MRNVMFALAILAVSCVGTPAHAQSYFQDDRGDDRGRGAFIITVTPSPGQAQPNVSPTTGRTYATKAKRNRKKGNR